MATEYTAVAPLGGIDIHHDGFSGLDMQLRLPLPSFLGDDIAMVTPSTESVYTYEHRDADHDHQPNTYSEQDVPRFRSWGDAVDLENDLPDMQYEGENAEFQEGQDARYEVLNDGEWELDDGMEEDEFEYDMDEAFRCDMVREAEWNYFQEDLQCPTPLPLTDADLEDPPGTRSVAAIVAQKRSEGYFQERWTVDKESATFLAFLARDHKADAAADMRYYLPTPLRHLKAAEPVLQCDPATEMRAVLERNEVYLTAKGVSLFKLDASKDESLEWGAANLALPERFKKELAAEKWHVDNETMAFMKSVIVNEDEALENWVRRERERKIICKLSPTLLPLSPPWSPTRHEPSLANLPIASTPEDPTAQEAAMLHAEITTRDEAEADRVMSAGMKNVDDFLVRNTSLSSTPTRKTARRLQSLKFSSPVLPQKDSDSSEPPSKKAKTVAFTQELHTIIPCLQTVGDMTDPEEGAREATASIIQMFRPLAKPALDRMANEKLCELDTTARVLIPAIPAIRATGPWDQRSGQQSLLKGVGQEVRKNEKRWSGASKLEKSLPWGPFSSHLAKIRPEGDFDDESCARYLKDLNFDEELDIQRLTWKPEGLRVLDVDEDGESDLEAADWPSDHEEEDLLPMDMTLAVVHPPPAVTLSLAVVAAIADATTRNERFAANTTMHKPIPALPAQLTPSAPVDVRSPQTLFSKFVAPISPAKLSSKPSKGEGSGTAVLSIEELMRQRKAKLEAAATKAAGQVVACQRIGIPEHTVVRGAVTKTSAGTSLHDQECSLTNANAMAHFGQFLRLQGQPDVSIVGAAIAQEVSAASIAGSLCAATKSPPVADISTTLARPTTSPIQILMPIIEDREREFSVVLSDAMMENRYLILKLQEHLPCLEIVVRDHALKDREADITVSAGTGLMTTNLQKLKQKPLPGQKAIAGIRERVATVAICYERLVVLVSEGKQTLGEHAVEISGLDERDEHVLSEFIGQCSMMDTEVQVKYISGGDGELFYWLAAEIARYGAGQDFTLFQEETYWEGLLRKAGLNTFASQVVLRELRVSVETSDSDLATSTPTRRGQLSGLADFICANEEERVQRFGPLLGGEGMLRRASQALDGRWLSAANAKANANAGASWPK